VAVLATALEQWSVYGVDNLSVPVVTGVLWQHWSS
jgi:dolichol kinase